MSASPTASPTSAVSPTSLTSPLSSAPAPQQPLLHLFRGTLIHAPQWGAGVQLLRDHLLAVDQSGVIVLVEPYSDEKLEEVKEKYTMPVEGMQVLPETQFLIPGFIDTHCHAPQFQFAGTGTDRDLMVWLQTYTFPAEMRMSNTEYAREVYGKLVRAALSAGTTTAFYYGTIHLEGTKSLVDTCLALGQRAFVGKVAMDQHSPEGYMEDTEASIRDTEAFIQYVQGLNNQLVAPVVTPRFIPTCSPTLLKGLAELAKKYKVWIQSHASESSDQVAFVQSLLPEVGAAPEGSNVVDQAGLKKGRCTGIFEHFGLLSDQCMMAHGTFLTPEEWAVFKSRGVSIASCPISNNFCSDNFLRVKACVNQGNKVGLGSDVAGGYALSILANIRQAVITSKFHTIDANKHPEEIIQPNPETDRPVSEEVRLAQQKAKEAQNNTVNPCTLSYTDAFWLATAGGAEAINMGDKLGRFAPGYIFDAQHINVCPNDTLGGSGIHVFACDTLEDIFQKFINLGDDRNVHEVYVQGRPVKRAPLQVAAATTALAAAAITAAAPQTANPLQEKKKEQVPEAVGQEVAAAGQA